MTFDEFDGALAALRRITPADLAEAVGAARARDLWMGFDLDPVLIFGALGDRERRAIFAVVERQLPQIERAQDRALDR